MVGAAAAIGAELEERGWRRKWEESGKEAGAVERDCGGVGEEPRLAAELPAVELPAPEPDELGVAAAVVA